MGRSKEYVIKEISRSISTIKVLKIYGHLDFNQTIIMKKIGHGLQEVLANNNDVDYLIVYFFPSREDMNNDAAVCFLELINNDVKKANSFNDRELSQQIRWNEDYGFFSDVVKEKKPVDFQLVSQSHILLQILEEAERILVEHEVPPLSDDQEKELDCIMEAAEKELVK